MLHLQNFSRLSSNIYNALGFSANSVTLLCIGQALRHLATSFAFSSLDYRSYSTPWLKAVLAEDPSEHITNLQNQCPIAIEKIGYAFRLLGARETAINISFLNWACGGGEDRGLYHTQRFAFFTLMGLTTFFAKRYFLSKKTTTPTESKENLQNPHELKEDMTEKARLELRLQELYKQREAIYAKRH